jgi:hypothetical protein
MPEVVSLAEYLSDLRRAAKVRHNEAVAYTRMEKLIEQSDRRIAASERRLRRASQLPRSPDST